MSRDLQLDQFEFLTRPIREEDKRRGKDFVYRYTRGPQDIWRQTHDLIESLPKLWSVSECPDEFLQYLKWIVGLTSELDALTRDLTALELRRLIGVAVQIWKDRGPEDTVCNVLRFLTGARGRYFNWFDLRWIVGENFISHQNQGEDPWLVGDPYSVYADESRVEFRLVDNGSLNRSLVRAIARELRATGERLVIRYISFLDLFQTEHDTSQWYENFPTTFDVTGGHLCMTDDTSEEAAFVLPGWIPYEHMITCRLGGTVSGSPGYIGLIYQGTWVSNTYYVALDILQNRVVLIRRSSGGGLTILQQKSMADFDFYLKANTWYMLSVATTKPNLFQTNRLFYLDNMYLFSDTSAAGFSMGLIHTAGATLCSDEIEGFNVPLESDFIDINS